MAALTSAVAETLRRIGVAPQTATFAAQAAVTVFTAAYADWVTDPAADLDVLMRRSLTALRQAVGQERQDF